MSKKEFFFQNSFSKSTYYFLKRHFKLSDDDKILLTVWLGHIHNLAVRDRYFCFTKHGLYWNFPAIVQIGEEGQPAERTLCDSDFFQKEGSSFSLVFTKCDGDLNELHVKMDERTFIFQFTKSFPKESLEELEKIIRDYFTGYFDEKKYDERAGKDYWRVVLYTVPDFLSRLGDKIENTCKNFWNNLKEKVRWEGKASSEKKENKSSGQKNLCRKDNAIISFLRHCLDLFTDLIFAAAVVALVKPEILQSNSYYESFKADGIRLEIFMNLRPELGHEALMKRNLIVTTFFAVFLILKLLVILTNKNAKKIVPLLLIIILGVSSILIPINFTIFLLLALLILLTLQFSMDFSAAVIKRKICFFLVFSFSMYVGVHILFDEKLQESLCEELLGFFNALRFPAKWW